jgi:hypothetical protein
MENATFDDMHMFQCISCDDSNLEDCDCCFCGGVFCSKCNDVVDIECSEVCDIMDDNEEKNND